MYHRLITFFLFILILKKIYNNKFIMDTLKIGLAILMEPSPY